MNLRKFNTFYWCDAVVRGVYIHYKIVQIAEKHSNFGVMTLVDVKDVPKNDNTKITQTLNVFKFNTFYWRDAA